MSDTDWWFLDLALVIAVTGLLALGLFTVAVPGPIRVLLGVPFLLFLPGYALVAILYPDESDGEYPTFDDENTGLKSPLVSDGGLESIERLILSVVASVAVVPVVALVASVTPWGITARPVIVGIALVTVLLSLFAIVQRYRCPPERRFSLSPSPSALLFSPDRDSFGRSAPNPAVYNVIFLGAIVLLLVSAGFAVANPPEHDGYTEFYMETEEVDGETEVIYDDALNAGESQPMTVYVTNEEHEERSYTTVAVLQQVSYEEDGVTVHEEDVLTSESTTVADGETNEQTLEIEPTMTGDDLRLVFLLYEGEPPEEPTEENAYRTIELPITVS